MTPTEAAKLCAFAAQCFPQQKINEFTPDAWGLILAETRYADAQEALVLLARKQPFVSPAEIIAQVKRVRAKRIDEYGPIIPPAGLDPIETVEWLAEARRTVGNGEPLPNARGELKPRDMRALTAFIETSDK